MGRGPGSLAAALLALLVVPSFALAERPLYVADEKAKSVVRVDAGTGVASVVTSGGDFAKPSDLAVDRSGQILVADRDAFGGSGGVIRVDPATGAQAKLSSGGSFKEPRGITVAADGTVLVADRDAFGGSGGVIRVDPATGAQTKLSSGGFFNDPAGIAIAPNGAVLVTDTAGSGKLVRVNPTTGAQAVVTSAGSLDDPYGVEVAGSWGILVADPKAFGGARGVIAVNPATGAQTAVSSGGSFNQPRGVVVLGNADLAVVDSNAFSGAVIRVAQSGGVQTTISAGLPLEAPVGIAIPPDLDGDEVPDYSDNCPAAPNENQADGDRDGVGDACDSRPHQPDPGSGPQVRLGVSVQVAVKRGVVLYKTPKRSSFVKLTDDKVVPIGAEIDARRGTVVLTSALATGGVQSGDFNGGRFRVRQPRKKLGRTDLVLTGKKPRRCHRLRGASRHGVSARSSRKRHRRRLWGDAHGKFSVKGRNSVATVRGTRWLVEDRCYGTLTRVVRGVVSVRDFRRERTVTVRAGEHYLARTHPLRHAR